MAEHDGQEKSEQPTPRRLEDARKRGQVPRSRELNTFTVIFAGAAALLFLGDSVVFGLQEIFVHSLQIERTSVFDPSAPLHALIEFFQAVALLLIPFFAIAIVAALLGPIAIGGVTFNSEAIAPKFSKLNPIKGLSRIFSWRGFTELVKALLKFVLIAAVGYMVYWQQREAYLGLNNEPLQVALAHAGELLSWGILALTLALLVIAAIDVPFQLWDHQRQLRMTRQEVKDEIKETEGRPEVRGRIRQLQREMARHRMMEAIPEADVVVTNPTHFAVALEYDPLKMRAPRVVAKGSDLIAVQIRGVARESDVPVLEAPLLARALYYSTELDEEIPAGLYVAVAQVLAYIFQLQAARRGEAQEPVPPTDLPVPDEFLSKHGPHRHSY